MKKKIGVLGCCISRDAFNSDFVHNYKEFFKLEISAQRTTIISFMQDPVTINEKLIEIYPDNKPNRAKTHCISYDLNKNFLKELIEKDIDYLIMDNFLEVRMGILYFNDHIITNNTWHLPSTKFYETINDELVFNIYKFPEEYFCIWSRYCDLFFKFLKIYCPNVKVILNKGRYVDKVLKSDKTTYVHPIYTSQSNIINPIIEKLDSYISDNFDVYTIEFDYENIYLDEEHMWGFAPVHYHTNYHYSLIEKLKNFAYIDDLNNEKPKIVGNDEKEKFEKELKKANFETRLFLKHIKNNNPMNNLSFYNQARIDMKNHGTKDNRIEVINTIIPLHNLNFPNWLKNEEGEGLMIRSEKGSIDIKIKCINDGILKISLRGPDIRDKNSNRFPVYIDYTNFTVNNEPILKENTLVWHDTPFLFKKEVKNSEILDLHVEWLPFNESSIYKK